MGGGEKARPPQRMKPQPSPAPATLPGVGAAVPELSERGSSTRRKRLGLQLGITPKACEEAIGIDRARRVLTCFAQRPMASARSPTCPHRRSAPAAKEVVPSELHSTPARAVSELGCRHHGRDLRRAAPTSWRARSGSRWPVVCIDARGRVPGAPRSSRRPSPRCCSAPRRRRATPRWCAGARRWCQRLIGALIMFASVVCQRRWRRRVLRRAVSMLSRGMKYPTEAVRPAQLPRSAQGPPILEDAVLRGAHGRRGGALR